MGKYDAQKLWQKQSSCCCCWNLQSMLVVVPKYVYTHYIALSYLFPSLSSFPPLSSVSPLLTFWQLLTDIGAHILFCLTLALLLLVCRCRDSHLLHLNKIKNNTFKVFTSSLKTAKKLEKPLVYENPVRVSRWSLVSKNCFFPSSFIVLAYTHTSPQLNLIAMARWSDPLTI